MDRCPSCGATVRAESPWCTLCYAPLRPDEPGTSGAPAPGGGLDPLTAPLALLEAPPVAVPAAPEAETVARAESAGWPCLGCGAVVELDLAACPTCGTAFLAGAALDAGDPLAKLTKTTASTSVRVAIMVGGTVLVMVVLTLVATLLGLVL